MLDTFADKPYEIWAHSLDPYDDNEYEMICGALQGDSPDEDIENMRSGLATIAQAIEMLPAPRGVKEKLAQRQLREGVEQAQRGFDCFFE